MKKRLIAVLLTALTSTALASDLLEAPNTSDAVVTTAGVTTNTMSAHAVPHALTSDARITVTSLLLPDKASPSWVPAATKVINDALSGTLPVTAHSIANPTDYTICPEGHIDWFNLVDSQNTALWQSQLNPPSPFDQERGQELWFLIQAWSTTGIDDVSMDSLGVTFDSNDGHILAGSVSFAGTTYTPLALARTESGQLITSGDASQKGQRVIVLVHAKNFTGGDTQSGLDQVRNWVTPRTPYTVSCTVQVGSSSSSAVATTGTTAHQPFSLMTLQGNSSIQLWIDHPETNAYYRIWGRTNVQSGDWYLDGVIMGSGTNTFPTTVGVQRFFKAERQQ